MFFPAEIEIYDRHWNWELADSSPSEFHPTGCVHQGRVPGPELPGAGRKGFAPLLLMMLPGRPVLEKPLEDR